MSRKKVNFSITGISLAVLTILLLMTPGCQRDDICPATTQTTPLLRIAFYDSLETDIPKPPVNLRIRSLDPDTIIFARINEEEILLPLRTDVDVTRYEFIRNAPAEGEEATEENSDIDTITFTYAREELYINRACSFKVNYIDLRANFEDELENRWIYLLTVEEDNIIDETEPHISIYH